MNLLNTMLVYMAVLATSATGTMPSVTLPPVELVTPPPAVTATQLPSASPAPGSTALIVPPPEMTQAPIDASLTTVATGDRGQNVRTLQKRLIELGYLAEGEDDGMFGKRTKRAVERFQNYNNLKVDGIAGKNTLTKLYKDPNVILAPVDVGPAPTATLAPTQKPIVTVTVIASYTDTDGKLIAKEELLFQQGVTTYKAHSSLVPKGYVLVSDEAVRVTVTADGKANPSSI
ncbi:MAG: peptidoglycan-binding domain-containing protein, partial [Eubacteriales bacterium]|nr:peptidoglycan-binding domain-containing protein [Eubacteriales bacterium]